jgi:outer membrane receptor protein involved in Fe transport
MTFYVAGNNLTDQIYIANRAPQGIQPAGFRQVFLGLEWNFPRPAQRPLE